MYKTGEKVKVRLSDGKVKMAVIQEYVPDLYTHTPGRRPDRQD